LETIRERIVTERKHLTMLEETKQALEQKVRLSQEDMPELPLQLSYASSKVEPDEHDAAILEWLDHRKEDLAHQIKQLQQYLQAFSRQKVKEEYGPGPHRIRITVEFVKEQEKMKITKNRSFVVELASLDELPHSVHYFLDMVKLKLWDHTFFLHHENVEHVIAGVPIDYRTQKLKTPHLASLGWSDGLAFPECSPRFPHTQYTIGFAHRGPTFYLNTLDNTLPHGPGGGQGHHLLPEDGDPCFGKVVEGREVVDDLIEYGMAADRKKPSQANPGIGSSDPTTNNNHHHEWEDEDHSWTHILKVEMV